MARAIDADRLKQAIDHDYYEHYTKYHDSDQTALIDMVMDDIDEMPTLTPPNEALTLGLVDKYGAPLYAGDTVAVNPPIRSGGIWKLFGHSTTKTKRISGTLRRCMTLVEWLPDTRPIVRILRREYKTCCCISTARRRYRHETAIHPRRAGIHHPGDRNLH